MDYLLVVAAEEALSLIDHSLSEMTELRNSPLPHPPGLSSPSLVGYMYTEPPPTTLSAVQHSHS